MPDARIRVIAENLTSAVMEQVRKEMQATGAAAGQANAKIADGAKQSSLSMGSMTSAAKTMAAAFGIGFSVSAAVGFGKEIMADADALMKMSDQTGVSMQALQKFQIVGDDAGVSVEKMNNAVFKLQSGLSGGGMAALKELGIPFEDIKNLAPENQFIAISDAIRGVKNPTDQARLAGELFGDKLAKEVLPALKAGFDDVKGSVVGMSDETIRALDEAGDQVGAWWRLTKGYAAEATVYLVRLAQDGISPLGPKAAMAAREMKEITDELERMNQKLPDPKVMAEPFKAITSDSPEVKRFLADIEEATKKQAKATKDATDEQKRARDEQDRWRKSVDDATVSANLSVFTLSRFGMTTLPNVSSAFAEVRAQTEGWIPPLEDATGAVEDLQRSGRFAAATLASIGTTYATLPDVHSSLEGVDRDIKTFGIDARGALSDVATILDSIPGKFAEIGAVAARTGAAIMDNLAQGDVFGASVAAVTGGVQIITSLFRDDVQIAVNQTREAFVQAAGGIDELNRHAHDAGVTLDRFLDARNPEQYQAAIEELNSALEHQSSIVAAAGRFGPSRTQLRQMERDAQETFDHMRNSGEYTAEQLTLAYAAFQQAMAAAGNEAAKQWIDAQTLNEKSFQDAEDGLTDLIAQRNSLVQSISAEAPEEVMGVIEAQQRGQLAVLNDEIADKADAYAQLARDAGHEMASAITDALANIHIDAIVVPYRLEGSGGGGGSFNTEADGNSYANEGFDIATPRRAWIGDNPFESESVLHASTVKDIVRAARAGRVSGGSLSTRSLEDRLDRLANRIGDRGGNVYVVVDSNGGGRRVSEGEFQQIQRRLNSGGLVVPSRSIVQRAT